MKNAVFRNEKQALAESNISSSLNRHFGVFQRMYSRAWKAASVFLILVVVLGTSFIYIESQRYVYPRPSFDLEAYSGDIANLTDVAVAENIEIRVIESEVHTVETHSSPKTLGCSTTLDLTNIGDARIDDLRAVMGTAFNVNDEVVCSFYIRMVRIPGYTTIETASIAASETERVKCYAIGQFVLEGSSILAGGVYLRILIQFDGAHEVIITTPLDTEIMAFIE